MYAMKSKIIIPRKDHEIYFIQAPVGLRSYKKKRYVLNTLSELHPGFSADCDVDIKSVMFNKSRWFMATVMASDVLSEYRILYNGALFYTNTSILVCEKIFSSNGPVKVDDEQIGFDPQENKPVSIPLENEGNPESGNLKGKLTKIKARESVFKMKNTKLIYAAIFISLAALSALLLMFINFSGNNREIPFIITEQSETPRSENIYLPGIISVLADISKIFLNENGLIEGWQYNEEGNPCIIIQSSNISALITHNYFSKYEYFLLHDIQNIHYEGVKPLLTVVFNGRRNSYSIPGSLAFTDKDKMIVEISELKDLLIEKNVKIISEILPCAANYYLTYIISFKADEKSLVDSLETMEEFCEKYSMRVKNMDISPEADKKSFFITCALSRADIQDGRITKLDEGKESILPAFGYKPEEIKPVKIQMEEIKPQVLTPVEVPVIVRVIGSITDSDGRNEYYQDLNGKISIRNEL